MAGKRHEKRFIVEVFGAYTDGWSRSGNTGVTQAFPTREAAKTAIRLFGSACMKYRVRQK